MADSTSNMIGLIDFDGTLFDTDGMYDACIDQLLSETGMSTARRHAEHKHDVDAEYGFITGTGWRRIIPATIQYLWCSGSLEQNATNKATRGMLSDYDGGDLPERDVRLLVSRFTELCLGYIDRIDIASIALPAGVSFARRLHEAGVGMSIHTGTEPQIVAAILGRAGMLGMFDGIESSRLFATNTGDADDSIGRYKAVLLRNLMDEYDLARASDDGIQPAADRFFVFGDSDGDMVAAGRLGLPFVQAYRNGGMHATSVTHEGNADGINHDGTVSSGGMQTARMRLAVDGDGSEIGSVLARLGVLGH